MEKAKDAVHLRGKLTKRRCATSGRISAFAIMITIKQPVNGFDIFKTTVY